MRDELQHEPGGGGDIVQGERGAERGAEDQAFCDQLVRPESCIMRAHENITNHHTIWPALPEVEPQRLAERPADRQQEHQQEPYQQPVDPEFLYSCATYQDNWRPVSVVHDNYDPP